MEVIRKIAGPMIIEDMKTLIGWKFDAILPFI